MHGYLTQQDLKPVMENKNTSFFLNTFQPFKSQVTENEGFGQGL